MRPTAKPRRHEISTTRVGISTVLSRLTRHEQRNLQGHWSALAERVALARRAQSMRELVNGQLDLVPESLRRLQRNASARRALLAELGGELRLSRSKTEQI